MIQFTCPGCQKIFKADESLRGRTAKCKQCGSPVRIPAAEVTPPIPIPTSDRYPPAHVSRVGAQGAPNSPRAEPRGPSRPPPTRDVQDHPYYAQPALASGAPATGVGPLRPHTGLGTATMVLGIIAICISWIPIIGCMTFPLCIIGIVLGLIELVSHFERKDSRPTFPIVGLILSTLAILIAFGFPYLLAFQARQATQGPVINFNPSDFLKEVPPIIREMNKIDQSARERNANQGRTGTETKDESPEASP